MFFATKLTQAGQNEPVCAAPALPDLMALVEREGVDSDAMVFLIYLIDEGRDIGGPIDSYWRNPGTGEWAWVVGRREVEPGRYGPAQPPAPAQRQSHPHNPALDVTALRRPPVWESIVPSGS